MFALSLGILQRHLDGFSTSCVEYHLICIDKACIGKLSATRDV